MGANFPAVLNHPYPTPRRPPPAHAARKLRGCHAPHVTNDLIKMRVLGSHAHLPAKAGAQRELAAPFIPGMVAAHTRLA